MSRSNPENLPENTGKSAVVSYLNGDTFQAELVKLVSSQNLAERFTRVCLNQFASTPKLLECSMVSISSTFLRLAELGLEPGRDAYLIPREEWVKSDNGKRQKTGRVLCSPMIKWEGYIRAARRSGNILRVWGDVVRAGDDYEIIAGSEFPRVKHSWRFEDERGDVIGAYACAEWSDGRVQTIVRGRDYLDACRDASDSYSRYKSGPWADWYQEMCIKSMIKLLCKSLPLGPEDALAMAASLDVGDHVYEDQEELAPPAPRVPTKAERVRARAKGRGSASLPPGPDELEDDGPPGAEPERDPDTGEVVPSP